MSGRMPRLRSVAAVSALLVTLLLGDAQGDTRASAAAAGLRVDRFDAQRAWRIVKRQLAYGQRPAGSAQLRQLAVRLRRQLPNGRFEPLAGEPGLRNVVGTVPGRRPGILIGAHYDTLVKPTGFVGANNGAAGSAIVIEAARALIRVPRTAGDRESPSIGLSPLAV